MYREFHEERALGSRKRGRPAEIPVYDDEPPVQAAAVRMPMRHLAAARHRAVDYYRMALSRHNTGDPDGARGEMMAVLGTLGTDAPVDELNFHELEGLARERFNALDRAMIEQSLGPKGQPYSPVPLGELEVHRSPAPVEYRRQIGISQAHRLQDRRFPVDPQNPTPAHRTLGIAYHRQTPTPEQLGIL